MDGDTVFDFYFNSIWLTVITLTTIGYGDISPLTPPGKVVVMILAFWGAVLLSLLVVVMVNVFELNEDETIAKQQVLITKKAAETISKGFKYFLSKKKTKMLQYKAG